MQQTEEYYNELFEKWWVVYENEHYRFICEYSVDSDGEPVFEVDPQNQDQFSCHVLPKNPDTHPYVSFSICPVSELIFPSAGFIWEQGKHIEEIKDESGPWADARKTVEEVNDIIKKLFPGHHIVNENHLTV